MGLVGFWWLEISSLLFVYMLFSFFLSGHMFPLDMLPRAVADARRADAAAVPGLFSRGRVPGKDPGLGPGRSASCIEAGWVVFFIVLSRVLFHYGTRRYSAYGG